MRGNQKTPGFRARLLPPLHPGVRHVIRGRTWEAQRVTWGPELVIQSTSCMSTATVLSHLQALFNRFLLIFGDGAFNIIPILHKPQRSERTCCRLTWQIRGAQVGFPSHCKSLTLNQKVSKTLSHLRCWVWSHLGLRMGRLGLFQKVKELFQLDLPLSKTRYLLSFRQGWERVPHSVSTAGLSRGASPQSLPMSGTFPQWHTEQSGALCCLCLLSEDDLWASYPSPIPRKE